MGGCASDLVAAGAELVILATNTMHLCAPAIERALAEGADGEAAEASTPGQTAAGTAGGTAGTKASEQEGEEGTAASGQRRFLHIADTTAAAICEAGFKRPGLMATKYTMEQMFIREGPSVGGALRGSGSSPKLQSFMTLFSFHPQSSH